MWRLIRALIYLAILGFAGLVAYAYLGPYFGADFSAPRTAIRESVTLEAE